MADPAITMSTNIWSVAQLLAIGAVGGGIFFQIGQIQEDIRAIKEEIRIVPTSAVIVERLEKATADHEARLRALEGWQRTTLARDKAGP